MRVSYGVLAEYVNRGDGGKLNIMGVFNKIGVATYPTSFGGCFFVGRLIATKEESDQTYVFTLRWEVSKDNSIFMMELPFHIDKALGGWTESDIILLLPVVTFPFEGVYRLVFAVDKTELYSTELIMEKA